MFALSVYTTEPYQTDPQQYGSRWCKTINPFKQVKLPEQCDYRKPILTPYTGEDVAMVGSGHYLYATRRVIQNGLYQLQPYCGDLINIHTEERWTGGYSLIKCNWHNSGPLEQLESIVLPDLVKLIAASYPDFIWKPAELVAHGGLKSPYPAFPINFSLLLHNEGDAEKGISLEYDVDHYLYSDTGVVKCVDAEEFVIRPKDLFVTEIGGYKLATCLGIHDSGGLLVIVIVRANAETDYAKVMNTLFNPCYMFCSGDSDGDTGQNEVEQFFINLAANTTYGDSFWSRDRLEDTIFNYLNYQWIKDRPAEDKARELIQLLKERIASDRRSQGMEEVNIDADTILKETGLIF